MNSEDEDEKNYELKYDNHVDKNNTKNESEEDMKNQKQGKKNKQQDKQEEGKEKDNEKKEKEKEVDYSANHNDYKSNNNDNNDNDDNDSDNSNDDDEINELASTLSKELLNKYNLYVSVSDSDNNRQYNPFFLNSLSPSQELTQFLIFGDKNYKSEKKNSNFDSKFNIKNKLFLQKKGNHNID